MLTAIYYFYRDPKLFSGGDLRLYDLRARPGHNSDTNSDSDAFVTIAPEQNTRSFRLVRTTVRTSGCSKRIRWIASCSSISTPRS